eukprot:gene7594-9726_t
MDDKFVHEAVLETLDLLVSAIEQITTRAVKFADDSVVDNSSLYAATLEEINRDLLGLFGNFESGTHDDFHGNTDSNAVDNSEGRFAATESAASESFQHSDSYWNEVCLEDEVEYQETCSTTKVWLNSELTSLNERAVRREQLAKLIKLENNAAKIQRFILRVICRKRRKHLYERQQLESDLIESSVEDVQAHIFDLLMTDTYEEAVNLMRIEVFQISKSEASAKLPSPSEVYGISSSIFGSVSSFAFIPFAIGNENVGIPSNPYMKGARRRKSLSKLPANISLHKKSATEQRPIKFSNLRHRVETSRATIDNPCSMRSIEKDVSEFVKHRSFNFNLQNVSVEDVTDESLHQVSNPGCEGLIANVNKLTSLENLSITYPNLKVASLSDNHVLSLVGVGSLPNLLHLNLDSNRLEGGSE